VCWKQNRLNSFFTRETEKTGILVGIMVVHDTVDNPSRLLEFGAQSMDSWNGDLVDIQWQEKHVGDPFIYPSFQIPFSFE
jgi:hypothetical protein